MHFMPMQTNQTSSINTSHQQCSLSHFFQTHVFNWFHLDHLKHMGAHTFIQKSKVKMGKKFSKVLLVYQKNYLKPIHLLYGCREQGQQFVSAPWIPTPTKGWGRDGFQPLQHESNPSIIKYVFFFFLIYKHNKIRVKTINSYNSKTLIPLSFELPPPLLSLSLSLN